MTTPIPYSPSTAAWPRNAFDECDALARKTRMVARLANAAATLHQEGLANELFDIADELKGIETAMRDVVGNVCNDRFREAQQSTSNMLGAVLAMAAKSKG